MDYIIGVDLGQAQDFTALCVLERTAHDTGRERLLSLGVRVGTEVVIPPTTSPVYSYSYAARHLERLAKGTPYPAQVARVKELHDRLKGEGHEVKLVVDQTGVGRPVVDMLREVKLSPVAISITGGDTVSNDGDEYRVPKRDLVSTAQVLLQTGRLKIARELKEASTLTSELLAFKVSINLRGHDSYGNDVGEWRENPHDDLVLAVALACWYGEQPPPRKLKYVAIQRPGRVWTN